MPSTTSAVSMKLPPAAAYASRTSNDCRSSAVQPKTLPPRQRGNTSRLVLGIRPTAATEYSNWVSSVSDSVPSDLQDSGGTTPAAALAELEREVARRRTFAIISHPDAGKTTLTEKLLLYAGAIELAGAVRGAQGPPPRHVGLDGARAAARHLDHVRGARVRAAGTAHVAARHARPQGFQRGHLSRADRRRQRRDGDRRGQRRRGADAEAVRGLPAPPAADSHVHQQVRPAGARSAGAARRYRAHARHRRRAGELADRQRRTVSRRVRHPAPDAASVRARGAGAVSGAGRHVVARRSGSARDDRRRTSTRISASRSTSSATPARRSTSRSIARAGRRRSSSAAR